MYVFVCLCLYVCKNICWFLADICHYFQVIVIDLTLKGFLAGFNKSERESFTTTNRTINQKQQQQQTAKENYVKRLHILQVTWNNNINCNNIIRMLKKKQQSNSCVDVVAAVVVVLITDVFVVVQYTHSCSCIWPTYV